MYPLRRNRRLRANNAIRHLVRETILTPSDFLVPLFIVEGHGIKEEIPSMPNYYRLSLDNLGKEVKELWTFEGIAEYVVGYGAESRYVTTYHYDAGSVTKVVMKFRKK